MASLKKDTAQNDILPAIEGGKKARDDFLVFGTPLIEEEAISSVVDSLRSGWVGTGPKVKEFEHRMGAHLGIKHAIAVNSCTAALHLSLLAIGVGPGDEVIVPTYTFCATANSVLFTGAKPVFVDVDYETLNISIDSLQKAVNSKTKAIIPVHMAGLPVDMDKIKEFALANNLYVIEDSAHSVEGKYKGKITGSIGDLGCYSFYATKNLTTAEGGLIATDNDDFAQKIRESSLHGLSADAWKRFSGSGFKHYEVVRLGYKYNMTDLQASLGLVHLSKIYDYLYKRESIWQKYTDAFNELKSVSFPAEIPENYTDGSLHARHLYIIKLDSSKLKVPRDHIMNALQAEGIGCGIHYKPLHLHKFYRETLGLDDCLFAHANKLADEILTLPLSVKYSNEDIEDVISAFRKIIKYYEK